MTPDERQFTLLIIRMGLAGMTSGVLGIGIRLGGSFLHSNPLGVAGDTLSIAGLTLLVVATVAACVVDSH